MKKRISGIDRARRALSGTSVGLLEGVGVGEKQRGLFERLNSGIGRARRARSGTGVGC